MPLLKMQWTRSPREVLLEEIGGTNSDPRIENFPELLQPAVHLVGIRDWRRTEIQDHVLIAGEGADGLRAIVIFFDGSRHDHLLQEIRILHERDGNKLQQRLEELEFGLEDDAEMRSRPSPFLELGRIFLHECA